MASQFADMALSPLFDVVLFRLSSWGTGLSFMSISSLIMELWQFSFERDWPEIRKSEIRPPEFCPISGDWGKLEMPNLARMPLMKCYWMLQNYWVIKEKPTREGGNYSHTPTPTTPVTIPGQKFVAIETMLHQYATKTYLNEANSFIFFYGSEREGDRFTNIEKYERLAQSRCF